MFIKGVDSINFEAKDSIKIQMHSCISLIHVNCLNNSNNSYHTYTADSCKFWVLAIVAKGKSILLATWHFFSIWLIVANR